MFTGIVEELGSVAHLDGGRLRIAAISVLEDVAIGDSIAVNGCCLTVVAHDVERSWWEADLSSETLTRTTLGGLEPGAAVNLERAVRVADRLGGHLVQGHVDAVARIIDPVPDLRVEAPSALMRYFVEKGSVTVDGVSLTVVDVLADGFTVAIIPHTAAVTTLGQYRSGDRVNLEVDVLAKQVERLMRAYLEDPQISGRLESSDGGRASASQ
jgi:riboflavin synthase